MKQDVAEYLIDSFVDFKGEEHKIVACALSQSPEESEDGCKLAVGWVSDDSYVDTYDPDYAEICRVISVGISVCHPTDTFDKERGKTNAYNKALHDPECPTIYTRDRGIASKTLAKTFLKQEVNFLKENPERIIKGYDQMKARFDKKQALKARVEGLSDNEKLVMKLAMKEGVDVVGCVKLAEEAKAAGIEINEQD